MEFNHIKPAKGSQFNRIYPHFVKEFGQPNSTLVRCPGIQKYIIFI